MKYKKLIGILLILLGIAICAVWLGSFTTMLYERHIKYGHYDSFSEYFWTVGKSNLVLSIICGGIPAAIGTFLLCDK